MDVSAPVLPAPPVGVAPSRPAALAGTVSQALVFAVCALALLIVGAALDLFAAGVAGCLLLVIGVAVGMLALPPARFESFPGLAWAFVVGAIATVLTSVLWTADITFVPLWLGAALATVVVGLDWQRVEGLRRLPLLAGVAVVFAMVTEARWSYAAGVVWVVVLFAALASLESDARAGAPQVRTVAGGPPAPATGDALTSTIIAVAVALALALVLTTPSCQRLLGGGSPDAPDALSELGPGTPMGEGTPNGPGGQPGSGGGTAPQPGEGGEPGASGAGGSAVGSGDAADARYVPDPSGRYLIPEGGGGSGAPADPLGPIPSPADVPEIPRGGSVERAGPEGTTFTYEEAPGDDVWVGVSRAGDELSRVRFHDRADGLVQIDRYDPSGALRDTFFYDPEGQLGSGEPSGEPPPEREETVDEEPGGPNWWLLAGIVAAVLAAIGALVWWLRRRPPAGAPAPAAPPWALALARAIDAEGAARGHARQRGETPTAHLQRLAATAVPDERLPQLAEVLASALYGRHDPGPQVQAWCEETWSSALDAHPRLGRRERKALERSGSGAG